MADAAAAAAAAGRSSLRDESAQDRESTLTDLSCPLLRSVQPSAALAASISSHLSSILTMSSCHLMRNLEKRLDLCSIP